MTTKIESFLDRIEAITDESQVQTLVEIFCDIYNIDHAIYHAVTPEGRPHVSFTYSLDWAIQYEQSEYLKDDPVIRGAITQFAPIDWKRLDWSPKRTREFLGEAVANGVGNQGLTVPIRSPGGQFAAFTANHSANDDEWSSFRKDYNRDMLLAAHYMHLKWLEFSNAVDQKAGPDLSPRERDVLTLLGVGKSRGQIAEALRISEHTLRVYIDTARHKMGALNTTHAVALAQKTGKILI